MYSCTVIISHFESVPFLRACLRQIKNYENPLVLTQIFVVDQSSEKTNQLVNDEFAAEDVMIAHIPPRYSGYGVDWVLRNLIIESDYVAQFHVDAAPISDQYLLLPIKLMEEFDLHFVGQLQFINSSSNLAHIYPPNPFFAMAQCFNVGRTSTYKEMSINAGFTRFHQRPFIDMEFLNDDWDRWAAHDYKKRGSDDDVVAFHWEDLHRKHDKLGLAITGYVHPHFGRIIEDTVFHFGSARESVGVMEKMPQQYQDYYKKIQENYSDELIEEMISLAKANRPPELEILSRNYWNGETKISSPPTDEINKRIEELKNMYI